MKKVWMLTLLAGLLFSAQAQPRFFPHNDNLAKWYVERADKDMKTEATMAMAKSELKNLVKNHSLKTEDLLPKFHWLDFDRNGCPDLLFQGKIGEKNRIFLFRNLDDSTYVTVMETNGEIIMANSPEDRTTLSIAVWDHSCCGDRVSAFSRWACVQTNGTAFMQRLDQGLVYDHTMLPDAGKNCTPKARFKTINYASLLRMTPFIDDETPYDGVHEWKGNYVGKYPQGSTGTVYHQLTDKNGVVWYFVRMDNGSWLRIHSDRFRNSEEVENPNQYYYYGWMHSGNVKILD